MPDIDPIILDKIIELSNTAILAIEKVSTRIIAVEKSLDTVKYTLHGNGEPGLNEKVRDVQKELINVKDEINKISNSLTAIKVLEDNIEDNITLGDGKILTVVKELEDRIQSLEFVNKIIIAVTLAAATTLIGLVVNFFWDLITSSN